MRRFGSDRPVLLVVPELSDVDDLMRVVQFKVFSGPANDAGSRVVAMRVPNGCALSRGEIDAYTKFVGVYGAKGLAYIRVNQADDIPGGLQSPIVKTHQGRQRDV